MHRDCSAWAVCVWEGGNIQQQASVVVLVWEPRGSNNSCAGAHEARFELNLEEGARG